MDWNRLPLARATVDRAAHRRTERDLVAALRRLPSTRLMLVADGRLATRAAGDGLVLDLLTPDQLGPVPPEALELFLGEDDGTAYLAVAVADLPAGAVDLEGVEVDHGWAERTWSTLRDVGHLLPDLDAGLATTAVGLAAWHARHPRCPRCGSRTVPAQGGWTRTCTVDGSDHYPRTDPAVIMAVVDDDDRLLLGHAAHWPERRFSTLAGYVEPGESVEAAVRREVAEEVAVTVGDVTYRGSQPWPFPASLMLAYVARATSTRITVDGVEVTQAQWFTRAELGAAVADGTVLLPMRSSVARVLIEEWFGGPLGV